MSEEQELTTDQAATITGVSASRIRQLILSGKLPARKVGSRYRGQWLIKESDLRKARGGGE